MFRSPRFPRLGRDVAACLMLCLLLPAMAAAECPQVTYGADSPQALLDGLKGLSDTGDLGQMAAFLAPADRTKAVVGLTLGATMILAFQEMGMNMGEGEGQEAPDADAAKARMEELSSRLETILATHGADKLELGEDTMGQVMQDGDAALAGFEDQMAGVCVVGLLSDLAEFLSEVSGRTVTDRLDRLKSGDFGPIEVDGDVATSTIGGEPVSMQRIDGRWYVDIDSARLDS